MLSITMKSLTPDRFLQSQGFGSRKECQKLVLAGLFSFEGEIIVDLKRELNPLNQSEVGLEFSIGGHTYFFREKVYLALNKPSGYECSASPQHHLSVFDLLPDYLVNRGIQSAGRLDQNTTGLLLLSDDGEFIHHMTSPKHHILKTYEVGTRDPITQDQKNLLLNGVQLRGEPGPDKALEVKILGEFLMEMKIDQGKYHQVRRMIAATGNFCETLRRTAEGNLNLESLELNSGQWTFLDKYNFHDK